MLSTQPQRYFQKIITNKRDMMDKKYKLLSVSFSMETQESLINDVFGKGKGKAISLQAWTGPECSRRLRLPDFQTIGT